jgi:hypothetical protein
MRRVERIAKPAERGAALPVFVVICSLYEGGGHVRDIRGFHSYSVVSVSEKELVSIGIFEDKAGAAESSRLAAEFVKNDPIKDQIGTPQITEGELLISREAPVTA